MTTPFQTPEPERSRAKLVDEINSKRYTRKELNVTYGRNVYDTAELKAKYHVGGFQAPFVGVTDKKTGVGDYLCFQHNPRYYFHPNKEQLKVLHALINKAEFVENPVRSFSLTEWLEK